MFLILIYFYTRRSLRQWKNEQISRMQWSSPLGLSLLPDTGMLVYSRQLLNDCFFTFAQFFGTHLYSRVERGTEKKQCIDSDRARTVTSQPFSITQITKPTSLFRPPPAPHPCFGSCERRQDILSITDSNISFSSRYLIPTLNRTQSCCPNPLSVHSVPCEDVLSWSLLEWFVESADPEDFPLDQHGIRGKSW